MVTVTAGEDKDLPIRTAALIARAWIAWITSRCIPTQDVSSAGGFIVTLAKGIGLE